MTLFLQIAVPLLVIAGSLWLIVATIRASAGRIVTALVGDATANGPVWQRRERYRVTRRAGFAAPSHAIAA